MTQYALPRLKTQAAETIVDGGLLVCFRQENAEREALIRENGPVGSEMYRGIKMGVRRHMIVFVNIAKRQSGYR